MRIVGLALLAVMATSARAAPVYLACTLTNSEKTFPVEVTADEAEQRATVVLPDTGRVVTRKALFSPSEVRILDDPDTWVIDRTSLSLHRLMEIGEKRWDDAGKCSIKPTPTKRAF